jgi:hypothetical protein
MNYDRWRRIVASTGDPPAELPADYYDGPHSPWSRLIDLARSIDRIDSPGSRRACGQEAMLLALELHLQPFPGKDIGVLLRSFANRLLTPTKPY